tara:strand:- start:2739 stop:3737 length:999 start_codon:yes stop_codon:yes gene_type:complete
MLYFISVSIFLNVVLIIFFEKLSSLLGIFDKPDKERKLHKGSIASIGGVIFFLNLILFFIFLLFNNEFLNDYKLKFLNGKKQYFVFFILSSLIFFVGLIDDKFNLSALKKSVFFIFIIIFTIIDKNTHINSISLEFFENKISTNQLAFFISMISIFYFMNAINMFDGINIQTPLYLLLIFIFLLSKDENIVIFLFIPAVFFLFLNIRGKCFLGNSGSYFLGFIISIILIKINQANPNLLTSEEILILLSLPCFELFRLFSERIIRQTSPFSGDLNHIHHLLSKKFSVLTTSLMTNGFIFLPLLISQFFEFKIIIFIFQFIAYYLVIYKLKSL